MVQLDLEKVMQTNVKLGDLASLEPVLTFLNPKTQVSDSTDQPTPSPDLLQVVDALNEKSFATKKLTFPFLPPGFLSHCSTPPDTTAKPLWKTYSYNAPRSDPKVAPDSSTLETFTISLKSDGRFFKILARDLQALYTLHEQAETDLKEEIVSLSPTIALYSSNKSQASMQAWREIFHLYLDCSIFFSTREQKRIRNSPTAVQERLRVFSIKLNETGLLQKVMKNGPRSALDRFLGINFNLLRQVQYQELNKVAMVKILKSEAYHISGLRSQELTFVSRI